MQERTREAMTEQRQHEEHLQETMHLRTEEELKAADSTVINDSAREAMTEQRQHEEHLQETMLNRAAAAVGLPVTEADTSTSANE